jgi:hypothetical protein
MKILDYDIRPVKSGVQKMVAGSDYVLFWICVR